MNTPTQIAVKVITGVHQEFCREDMNNCYHNVELHRMWEQDTTLRNMVEVGNKQYRKEVMETLERARRKLVNPEDIEAESYAEWINSIFNLAIKSVKEMK